MAVPPYELQVLSTMDSLLGLNTSLCFPISSDLCNLRTAWSTCLSLSLQSSSSSSSCVIRLPKDRVFMNTSSFGELELQPSSNISIYGDRGTDEGEGEGKGSMLVYDRSLFHYQSDGKQASTPPSLYLYNLAIKRGQNTTCDTKSAGPMHLDGDAYIGLQYVDFYDSCGRKGGALSVVNNSLEGGLTLDHCSFQRCRADIGGAVYVDRTQHLLISHSSFTSCTANFGGGLYLDSFNEYLGVRHSSFDQCSAHSGAAMYVVDSSRG